MKTKVALNSWTSLISNYTYQPPDLYPTPRDAHSQQHPTILHAYWDCFTAHTCSPTHRPRPAHTHYKLAETTTTPASGHSIRQGTSDGVFATTRVKVICQSEAALKQFDLRGRPHWQTRPILCFLWRYNRRRVGRELDKQDRDRSVSGAVWARFR